MPLSPPSFKGTITLFGTSAIYLLFHGEFSILGCSRPHIRSVESADASCSCGSGTTPT
ncbi:hypothetical protein CONLIGDRAFT_283829 [Coniochaeta ligniaria NRRL 30616]|uniref:Uncharacterized protein n=1 Tax=Coniochaeta ligniaria NRRL 30616 TaxID=1408157 RepID=A0A1J7ITQ6_9PEZI|nr:hypothetical protein CONLIGDRAFT_283829 [Coniochaeta ligniaria NRRL 30616]